MRVVAIGALIRCRDMDDDVPVLTARPKQLLHSRNDFVVHLVATEGIAGACPSIRKIDADERRLAAEADTPLETPRLVYSRTLVEGLLKHGIQIDGVHRINLVLLLTPHSRKKTHPVLAHDLSDAWLRPAILLQRRGEIGKMLDAAKLGRHDDIAEAGEFPAVALVMRDVAEKLIAVTLGEIGSDPDLIL